MLVLTIEQVPGHRVVRILGEVLGVTMRLDNPYVEGVKGLDGSIHEGSDGLTRTRQDAVAKMVQHAHRLGANAVVGMRFDHRKVGRNWVEVCAYGTAMQLVPLRQPVGSRQEAA